jgi:hypothetical protein
VFTEAWVKLEQLREPAAFPGWILVLAIARSRATDAARRHRQRRRSSEVHDGDARLARPRRHRRPQALRRFAPPPRRHRRRRAPPRAGAGETDTITLWNLLGVTREAILDGDPGALERWRSELQLDWGGSTRAIRPHR